MRIDGNKSARVLHSNSLLVPVLPNWLDNKGSSTRIYHGTYFFYVKTASLLLLPTTKGEVEEDQEDDKR